MRECSGDWRVKLGLCAGEEPLRNSAGDDKVLASEDERGEPEEGNNVDDVSNNWHARELVLGFVKLSILIIVRCQISWTLNDNGKVDEHYEREGKRDESQNWLEHNHRDIDEGLRCFLEELSDKSDAFSEEKEDKAKDQSNDSQHSSSNQ